MKIGLLIGSVLPLSEDQEIEPVETPYGQTSSGIMRKTTGPHEVLMLARHGMPPSIPPHMVEHRANIHCLKQEGVDVILSVCSTGSLKKNIDVPAIAIPSDFIDLFSNATFFDKGIHHATPGLDEKLQSRLAEACRVAGFEPVTDLIYVQMRGPRLETRAEIKLISSWGDLVGMNLGPEATLAIEMDIPVGSILTVDNYANGIIDETLDFRDILKGARTRYEDIMEIISNLGSFRSGGEGNEQ